MTAGNMEDNCCDLTVGGNVKGNKGSRSQTRGKPSFPFRNMEVWLILFYGLGLLTLSHCWDKYLTPKLKEGKVY